MNDNKNHSEAFASARLWFRHADLSHRLMLALFCRAAENPRERPPADMLNLSAPLGGDTEGDLRHVEILKIGKADPQALVGRVRNLPSLPQIFTQLITVMGDESSSVRDFEQVILQDPALTARILKMVNSAYYGLYGHVSTVSRALTLIGTRELYAIAMGVSVMRLFRHIPAFLVDMASFWEHSVACGVIAGKLAETTNFLNPERFFVGGLLHDIGRLVLFECLPRESRMLLSAAWDWGELLIRLENVYLETNHAELGGILARRLHFPPELEEMIRFHHDPSQAELSRDAAVIQAADILANFTGVGSSGERFIPPLDGPSWDRTGIAVDKALDVLDAARPQVLGMLRNLLYSESGKVKRPFS